MQGERNWNVIKDDLTQDGSERTSCDLWRPVATDHGICYAFNSLPMDNFYHPSKFTKAFEKVYQKDLNETARPMEMGTLTDPSLGLTFILDRQTHMRSDSLHDKAMKFGTFKIGIQDHLNAMGLGANSLNVKIGHMTEILVTPSVLSSESNLRSLGYKARQCRFSDEPTPNMTIFKYYTQSVCEYECLLKRAREKCHCTPYSYPFQPDEDIKICDTFAFHCFEIMLRDTSDIDSCNCLPDCESTKFSFRVQSEPLDTTDFCTYSSDMWFYTNDRLHQIQDQLTLFINKYLFNLESVDDGAYFIRYWTFYTYSYMCNSKILIFFTNLIFSSALCKEKFETDIAVVKVRMATARYEETRQFLKMKLADKIASIGGTLGLFTGMSFLSIVEVAFWLAKGVGQALRGLQGSNKQKREHRLRSQNGNGFKLMN